MFLNKRLFSKIYFSNRRFVRAIFLLFIFCLLLFVLVWLVTFLFNFPKFLCYLCIVLFWSIGVSHHPEITTTVPHLVPGSSPEWVPIFYEARSTAQGSPEPSSLRGSTLGTSPVEHQDSDCRTGCESNRQLQL